MKLGIGAIPIARSPDEACTLGNGKSRAAHADRSQILEYGSFCDWPWSASLATTREQARRLTAKTATATVWWITILISCPRLDICCVQTVYEGAVLHMQALNGLDSTIVLANATQSDTESVVEYGVFHSDVGAVRLEGDAVISVIHCPAVEDYV